MEFTPQHRDEPQEHVLVPAGDKPGIVMMVWSDPDETPLEQIKRLATEADDAEANEGLKDVVRNALSQIEDAIYQLGNVTSAAESVISELSSAQITLESADLS